MEGKKAFFFSSDIYLPYSSFMVMSLWNKFLGTRLSTFWGGIVLYITAIYKNDYSLFFAIWLSPSNISFKILIPNLDHFPSIGQRQK